MLPALVETRGWVVANPVDAIYYAGATIITGWGMWETVQVYADLSKQLRHFTGQTAEDQKIDDLTRGFYLEFENEHPEAVSADGWVLVYLTK